MNDHVCTVEDCGHRCWLDDAQPTRDIAAYFGDAGTVDFEGPCNCDGHE